MLHLTAFAASTDETRYVLNGVLFDIQKNNMKLVATDGRRLACIEHQLIEPINENIHAIVPIRAVQELMKNLNENDEVKIAFDNSQLLVTFKNMVIMCRLVEGIYPDYAKVIPAVSANKVKIKRDLFYSAVVRASLLATLDYVSIKLDIKKDKITFLKSTPEIGESQEEVVVAYQGNDLAISFTPQYLLDVLKNLKEETVEFELTDIDKPGVFRSEKYVYILLPMRSN
jgi:DNA polymerase-3 subunit beta